MPFEGLRDDNFDLVNDLKDVARDAYSIRDDIGAKVANVYFYSKTEGDDPIWTQVLPTPSIRDLSFEQPLMEGGIVQRGDLALSAIPVSSYSEEDLRTDSMNHLLRKYWVIVEPGGKTKAYTTIHISRKLLSYIVHIRRYDSINAGELSIPNPV